MYIPVSGNTASNLITMTSNFDNLLVPRVKSERSLSWFDGLMRGVAAEKAELLKREENERLKKEYLERQKEEMALFDARLEEERLKKIARLKEEFLERKKEFLRFEEERLKKVALVKEEMERKKKANDEHVNKVNRERLKKKEKEEKEEIRRMEKRRLITDHLHILIGKRKFYSQGLHQYSFSALQQYYKQFMSSR